MALTLNTSHPLFANLKSFICVDGGVIKDLVQPGRVFTPHAAVTYGTNGYGEFFKTLQVSSNAQGVAFTPGMETCGSAQITIISVHTDATTVGAVLAVRGTNGGSASAISPGTFWTGSTIVAKTRMAGAWAGAVQGTIPLPTMVGFTRNGEASSGLIENGNLTAQSQLYYNGSRQSTYIGGDTTGAYGGCLGASHNYIIEFDVALDATQVSDLYASLGASGAISLLSASSGATSTIAATTANAVGSLTSNVSPVSTLNTTTANISAAWASSSGSATSTITVTTENSVGVLTSTGSTSNGTFTSEVLRDNTGAIVASKTLNHVALYNDTTGVLVVRKTGLSTDGSGVFSFTDAALSAGVTYRVDWEDVDGRRRMPRKVAT